MTNYNYSEITIIYYLQLEELEDNLIVFVSTELTEEKEKKHTLHIAEGFFDEDGILEVLHEAFHPFFDMQFMDHELNLITEQLSVKVTVKDMIWADITVAEKLESFDEAKRSLVTAVLAPIHKNILR